MSYTFCPNEMVEDLEVMARACPPFLEQRSPRRITTLASSLKNAVANAKATGALDFSWKTENDAPIQTSFSTNWKGNTRNFAPLNASISVEYQCRFIAETGRVVVSEGVTVVTIKKKDGDEEKVFHFDACPGGWNNSAGHPPFHMQFYGMVRDIPRLPIIIVHPIDVLSLAVLELHQSDWRKHMSDVVTRSKLRHFPKRQSKRMLAIIARWNTAISTAGDSALVSLQRAMIQPVDL